MRSPGRVVSFSKYWRGRSSSSRRSLDGAGIHAIYYEEDFPPYKPIVERNRDGRFEAPIYVGKAIPAGARRGGGLDITTGPILFRRLNEHAQSIAQAENLELSDFSCGYLVVDDIWIPLGESLLIEKFAPIWNSTVEGFGNHDPGSGRYNSQRPPWDVVHPGRPWADRLRENRRSRQEILTALSLRLSEVTEDGA